jgi:hypothetical protein
MVTLVAMMVQICLVSDANMAWPLPSGVRLGWATVAVPNPEPSQAKARVFLLRGTGVVFSLGFSDLCTQLRQAGIWAEDLRSNGDGWVCQHLRDEHCTGMLHGPIILIGHSRGGRHILDAARELQKAGITVDLLICVDVAFPATVPGNVRQAVNLYLTQLRVYPASILRPDPDVFVPIENIPLDAPDSPIPSQGLHHVNITNSPAVQLIILERIMRVIRSSPRRG